MDARKELLLASAARLYSMGVDLEAAREKLRQLVEQGVSYESEEMLRAYEAFTALDRQWKSLEREHLALRDEIRRDRSKGSENRQGLPAAGHNGHKKGEERRMPFLPEPYACQTGASSFSGTVSSCSGFARSLRK